MKFTRKQLVVGFAALLLVFVALGICYFLYQQNRGDQGEAEQNTNTAVIWKTYTHNRFGHHFSINLPTPLITLSNDPSVIFPSGLFSQDTLLGFTSGSVRFYINQDNKSLKKWILEDHHYLKFSESDLEQIILDGQEAYQVHLNEWSTGPGDYLFAFVAKGNIVYEISIGNHPNFTEKIKPYYEDVINSFKFINADAELSVVDPSEKLDYKDQNLAISFKHPSGWTVKAQTTVDTEKQQLLIYEQSDFNLGGVIYVSNDFESYDSYIKSYQATHQPSLLSTNLKQLIFAGFTSDYVDRSIDGKEVARLLFTSQDIYKPFYILYDPSSKTQQEIVDSFVLVDTKSSLSNSNIQEKYLLAAQKGNSIVEVKKINILDNTTTTLFTYNEIKESDTSGNLWEGLPPSVSLSHDGNKIVYTSSTGLYVYTISSKKTEVLINRVADAPENTEEPPTWSSDQLKGVYVLAYPHWSSDDKYISFSNGYYEGSKVKIYDLTQKKVISLLPKNAEYFGTSYRLKWSESSVSYVLPNSEGYQTPGLFIGKKADLGSPEDYSNFVSANSEYEYADFSSNGNRVVAFYKENYEDPKYKISVLDVDQKTNEVIAEVKEVQKPFFGADDNKLYYFDETNKNELLQYNLLTHQIDNKVQLPTEFNNWEKIGLTEEKYIQLWASIAENPGTVASDSNRLYLLDPNDSKLVYTSTLFKGFTTFLGFTN